MSLKINDILVTTINKYLTFTDSYFINIISIDNSKIILFKNNKFFNVSGYDDYTIGIILDDGFIPSGTSLGLHRNNKPVGCSFLIKRRNKTKYDFLKKDIRFCAKNIGENYDLLPLKLICKVKKIDKEKKFMDLSIKHFYKLTSNA